MSNKINKSEYFEFRRPLTLKELVAEVENISDEEIDAVIIPPEVDELTDEEQVDDDLLRGYIATIYISTI